MSLYELTELCSLGDERGSLVVIEGNQHVPFDVKRVYYIYETESGISRGFHAHKTLQQFAVCVAGSCRLLLDDGNKKQIVELNSPEKGVLIDKMIWHEMYDYSTDCVMLVLASDHYDESDYIRDYEKFMKVA